MVRIRWQSQDLAQFTGMPGQSRVAKENYARAARAMGILTDEERWAWLLKPTPKITALAALGRLQMEEMMRMAADEACERKMTYRETVAFVRKILAGTVRAGKARCATLCAPPSKSFGICIRK